MLAPEPFFEPRGTPFSEFHRIKALGALGHSIDLVTYPIGRDVDLPNLRIIRSLRPPFVRSVRIGPSAVKVVLDALMLLTRQPWRVTPQSNRIGLRLHGEQPLARARHDELPSEGTVTGAIQVPAGGQPVLFLADHPLTGGYPVIAAVASRHLPLAAQLPVGCTLRFRIVAPFADLGAAAAPAKENPA